MIVQGIVFGLLAATFQSLSYVFSRAFVTKKGNTAGLLFALSHVEMGVAALAALPFLVAQGCPPLTQFYRSLLGASFFYLASQAILFRTLRGAEASRVAPLFGLKILILAFITVTFLGREVTWLQWAAAGLSVVAAFVLNYSGGSLSGSAVAGALLCCVGYSLSDLNIRFLVDSMGAMSRTRAIVLSCCLCYVLTGTVGLALLARLGPQPWRKWKQAMPVAFSWLAAMVFLFTTFATIGVLFGNIVQSSRGLISVLLGALIAWSGRVHLEKRTQAGVLWRRAAAAALMTCAVGMYMYAVWRQEKAPKAAPGSLRLDPAGMSRYKGEGGR